MIKRSRLIPLATLALFAAACTESAPLAPKVPLPPPPTSMIGTLTGTVEGTEMTATFAPMTGSVAKMGEVSPFIYGNQGVTISVTGTLVSLVDSVAPLPTSRRWNFKVGLRNLQMFPIGSNSGTTPATDSTGVFVFFTVAPVVTKPVPCAGCTVTVTNQSGSATFTGIVPQKFFWYNNRPAKYNGTAVPDSDATTNNPVWQFMAKPWTKPDTVHAFTFTLLVSAAWPPPNEASWRTTFLATNDSTPDIKGKPIWKKFAAPSTQTVGAEAFTIPTLRLSNADAVHSIYFSRNDSLGTGAAEMDATIRVGSGGGAGLQAVFGFAEPGGKQVFAGIFGNGISLVTFNEGTGVWTTIPGTFCSGGGPCRATNFNRTYRLRKIGTTSVVLCENAIVRATLLYPLLQSTTASFASKTVIFGMPGLAAPALPSRWTSVAYTIGNDGGSC